MRISLMQTNAGLWLCIIDTKDSSISGFGKTAIEAIHAAFRNRKIAKALL